MANDNASYFLQRAAEELAAAQLATCAASARVHHELSLRYSLRMILPEPQSSPDLDVPIAVPEARPVLAAQSSLRKATP